jgi:hypothetical protein
VDDEPRSDPAPLTPPHSARRLEYDDTRSSGISRRQMNFFLLLLSINTLLFAAFICLPGASPFLKQMWTDWQRGREEKRVAQARRAQVDDCLAYTLPPDQVVYAEAPADIAKLLAAAGRAHVVSDRTQLRGGGGGGGGLFGGGANRHQPNAAEQLLAQSGWREPAVLGRPEPMRRIERRLGVLSPSEDYDSVAFLHLLKTPSGRPRLVWISVDADPSLKEGAGDERSGIPHYVETDRRLTAVVFVPDDLGSATFTTIHFIEPPEARSRVVYYRTDDGVLHAKPWEPRCLWRILAGQPDPADATHVTIPYDVDGKPGVIDARLGDGDRLMFTPRAGRLLQWTGSNSYTWDLSAPPTTEPAK